MKIKKGAIFLFVIILGILFSSTVYSQTTGNYFTDFESDQGWTAAGFGQGKFEIGIPENFSRSKECQTTCLGTGTSQDHTPGGTKATCTNLNGHQAKFENVNTNNLTSPVYDFSEKTNISLELWRFMEIEGDNYDFCYYQYKNSQNGSWLNLQKYGKSRIDDDAWKRYTKNLTSMAAGKNYFQLRFYCTTDYGIEGSGLCIDDVNISWNSIIQTPKICGDGIVNLPGEQCDDGNNVNGDGCSSICKNETTEIYFVPYMGDIDGNIDPTWFFFYEKLRKWHDDQNIPVGLSFYPNTMNNNQFNQIIADMYNSKNIELLLKGESTGTPLDQMNYFEVKATIESQQNKFINELEKLGYSNVQPIISYNQLYGKFTETIRDAVHDLGFKIYLEQYVSEHGYIDGLPDFDITQYSVALTKSGLPGPTETFKQPEEVLQELIEFNHPQLIYINNVKVVPLLVHQQDFMIDESGSELNQTKWEIYTNLLLMTKDDSRIKMILPEEVYDLRHPTQPILTNYSVEICDWQDCYVGATSVSIDDSYNSCREELNKNGFKGTYYLSGTNKFTNSDWNMWNSIYQEGHELGPHTQTHKCNGYSDSLLNSELGSNYNDILTNISGISSNEIVSFAWPCGITSPSMESVASNYALSSRGYFINQLEDKNPANFMNLKSFNTPHYNEPRDLPPNYKTVVDSAESQGKWANLVFHNECQDDGSIDYLKTKNVWVAPIGTVVKYIKERQNTQIVNLTVNGSVIKFNIVNNLNHNLFNKELSLRINISKKVEFIKINGTNKNFNNENGSVIFNLVPSGNDLIEIKTNENDTAPIIICGNGIVEQGEQCDDGNAVNGDGCSSQCKIENSLCQYASSASGTSQNTLGSLAQYATGAPNAPFVGQCSTWSGYGYAWSPSNWNIKANLTLNYATPVYAKNLTIFGDFDMCWNRITLANSQTGQKFQVLNGIQNSCIYTQTLGGSFLADQVILETCGWGWSSTDAVQLCGET